MTSPKTPQQLADAIEAVVGSYLDEVRRTVQLAVESSLSRCAATTRRGKTKAARSDQQRATKTRRSAGALDELCDKLHQCVCARPGEPTTVLANELGCTVRDLQRPMAKLRVMRAKKGAPGNALAALWCGLQAGVDQDALDGVASQVMTEIAECTHGCACNPTLDSQKRSTSCTMSLVRRGWLQPRLALPSYLQATRLRYHLSKVSGVTKVSIFASALRPSLLAARASLRRCGSAKRTRWLRSCARTTAFSASRYSVTCWWSGVIQPAIVTGGIGQADLPWCGIVAPPFCWSENAMSSIRVSVQQSVRRSQRR